MGTFVDDEVLICGGESADFYEFRCWGYDYSANEWHLKPLIMHQGRAWAAAAPTYPNQWMVTGGYNSDYLSTGELLEDGRQGRDQALHDALIKPLIRDC